MRARHILRRLRRWRRWLIGVALLPVLCALRFPWAESDAGNWGIWSYGAFNTDEGEYTGGGRLMFLTGKWLDAEVGYPSTLTYAPAMHWLSAISYHICGLSIAAARWPSMIAAVLAWSLIYLMASRTTVPWLAGLVTLVASINPFSLTYERWGSSDVVFSAAVVAAWWLLGKHSYLRSGLAGAALGFGILAKMTAVVFAPFLFTAVLSYPQRRWQRAACFALGALTVYGLGQFWVYQRLAEAMSEGLNPADLPRVESMLALDWNVMLRALAVFPRAYTTADLGPFVSWLFVLPAWYVAIAWQRTGRLWTARTMLCASLFVYTVILALQPRNPGRYFLPLVYYAPLLVVYGRRLLPRRNAPTRHFTVAFLAVTAALFLVYWAPVNLPADATKHFACNAYILPDGVAWVVSWPVITASVVLLALLVTVRFGWRGGFRQGAVIGALALGTTGIFTANYGYAALGRQYWLIPNQLLIQASVIVGLTFVLGGWQWVRWRHWYVGAALLFYAAVILNPAWLRARPDLLTRSYSQRLAAERIARRVPGDATVIGRRASTLLESTALRVGHFTLCGLGKEAAPVFAERISQMLKTEPRGALYWLLASDAIPIYVSTYEKEVLRRFELKLVDKVFVRADAAPVLVPVYLLEVRARPRAVEEVNGGRLYLPLGR